MNDIFRLGNLIIHNFENFSHDITNWIINILGYFVALNLTNCIFYFFNGCANSIGSI